MPIPDREKQRREYMRKKIIAAVKSSVCEAFCLLLIIHTVWWLFAPFMLGHSYYTNWRFITYGLTHGLIVDALCLTLWPLILLGLTLLCACIGKRQSKIASAIPFVPAITPNNLPAEEVLVRSSQKPKQEQSAILLRAAENKESPAEELLRASTGE